MNPSSIKSLKQTQVQKKRFQSNPRWPPAPSKIMKQIQVQKNDFKLTLETVMVIGLGHAKPWTMISIKGTSPITKLQESPLLKKTAGNELLPIQIRVFQVPFDHLKCWCLKVQAPLMDDLTLSLVGSKKQMDNDGLAITGIT